VATIPAAATAGRIHLAPETLKLANLVMGVSLRVSCVAAAVIAIAILEDLYKGRHMNGL